MEAIWAAIKMRAEGAHQYATPLAHEGRALSDRDA
jgi:hypothetical protein